MKFEEFSEAKQDTRKTKISELEANRKDRNPTDLCS
jgi:hypothetical protein